MKIKSIFVKSCGEGDFYVAKNGIEIKKEFYSDDCAQPDYLECYKVYDKGILKTEIRCVRDIIIDYQ